MTGKRNLKKVIDRDLDDGLGEYVFDDDPLWKEPDRLVREAEEGLLYKPKKGWSSYPDSWANEVSPLFPRSPRQLLVALKVYSLLRTDHIVVIRNSTLAGLGINRRTKYKALTRLAEAGLIALDYAPGRTIRATLLWTPPVHQVSPLSGSINKARKKERKKEREERLKKRLSVVLD